MPKKMLVFIIIDLTYRYGIKLQVKNAHLALNSFGFPSWLTYPAGPFLKTIHTMVMVMFMDGSSPEES